VDPLFSALIVVIGFVASVSGGFWGLGGGWFILPCLFLTGVDVRIAVGACLLQMIPSTFPTVLRQFPDIGWKKGGWGRTVAIPLCLACTVGGVLGDPLGKVVHRIFGSQKVHQSVFLILLAWVLYDILKKKQEKHEHHTANAGVPQDKIPLTLGGGFITGLISGFLGIGGGTLTRPLMTSVLFVPEKQTGEIARLAILVTAIGGSIPYLFGGSGEQMNMMLVVGALLTVGSILGFSLGAKMHSIVLKAGMADTAQKSFGLIVVMVMAGLICKLTDCINTGRVIMIISGVFMLAYLGYITFKSRKHGQSDCIDKGNLS